MSSSWEEERSRSGGRARVASCALLALALACGGESPPASGPAAGAQTPAAPTAAPAAATSAPSADAQAEAQQIFATRCVACHGPEGGGNGPASAGLTPPPRDFRDAEWQRSVTDAHIEQIVQYGGAAVGRSAAMPSNPDLMSKPEVVAALRAYIRELAP